MSDLRIRHITILGGGTAGWMAAALLARFLSKSDVKIVLIESDELGTIGVGEATVPLMKIFNGVLGLDEWDYVKNTQSTFKLGIEFRGWGGVNNCYFNGFGDHGDDIEGIPPHHHWLKLRELGDMTPLGEYSFPYIASKLGKFAPPPKNPISEAPFFKYAYHFDASLYAKYLRRFAEKLGVMRIEGKVTDVELCPSTGFIRALNLQSGERIESEFYIDCSGFRGILIEQALKTGYNDWTHWLPCDRAVTAPCSKAGELTPYTISTAREAGWTWRIPLQHRTGNGYVYCSKYISDDAAAHTLIGHMDGQLLADPKIIQFTTGHRKKFWNKNCVAIGLASGFMEPLESTSIQLIQTALAKLVEFFPDKNFDPIIINEYNRQAITEFERIRDFLVLHYHCINRNDAPLWQYCINMNIPDELKHKLEVFKSCGQVPLLAGESYLLPSWVAVLIGQGVIPKRFDPMVDRISEDRLKAGMKKRRMDIKQIANMMPSHEDFIARTCAATT